MSNCVLLCLTCHTDIHANELGASLLGWIVWSDPEVCPCLRAGARARGAVPTPSPPSRGWVLLVPDGGLEYLSHPEGERLCLFVNSGLYSYLQAC